MSGFPFNAQDSSIVVISIVLQNKFALESFKIKKCNKLIGLCKTIIHLMEQFKEEKFQVLIHNNTLYIQIFIYSKNLIRNFQFIISREPRKCHNFNKGERKLQ